MSRIFVLIVLLICACAHAAPQGTSRGAPGLLAEYSNIARKVTVVTMGANFAVTAGESIDPRLAPDFRAAWSGSLNIVKREKYTFALEGSAGAGKLLIDGKLVTNAALDLEVGEHAIRVEFVRKSRAARQQWTWWSDDFLPEPVPLTALFHRDTPAGVAADDLAERGRLLVESLNCVACHATKSIGVVGRKGPDLTSAGNRLQSAWIARWLAYPQAFRHNTMMPRVPLNPAQIHDVTAYLATLKNPDNKIKEEQARPTQHVQTGKALFESIGCTSCHTRMDGEEGATKYPLHGVGSKWLTGQLAAYLENPLAVDHSGRMPSMLLNHDEARDLAEYLADSRDKRFEEAPPAFDAAAVARGKELVRNHGCMQCHTREKGQPAGTAMSVVLEKLSDGKGCLAAKPAGRSMDYHLSADQRKLIVAFIESVKAAPLITSSPVAEFYHKAATYGCTNCHELDLHKPVDEAERVPQLTDIGARLRPEWIAEVLTQRKRVRPWLHRRMPEFGAENVGNMPRLAAAVAGVGPAEKLRPATRDEILAGQKLIGSGPGGFACITCHGFNGAKPAVADDTRGPDITTVAARLRPDHFRRWVYDPKRVNPATPMPTFFEGVAVHEAAGKIDTMLQYCSAGSAMPPPIGWIDENNYTLAVRDRAIVQRCVMPNANGGPDFPRGIGVGLPGLVNYCFDADSCAVRYAWSGGFLDMQPSWAQRGGGEVRVLGKVFWRTNYPPLAVSEAERVKPWFDGYVLLPDGSPQWMYRIGGTSVKESVKVVEKGFGIVRGFEIVPHGHPITLTIFDHDDVDVQCSAGPMQAEQIQYVEGKPEKKPAHQLKFQGDAPISFSVTIRPKEAK